MNSYRLKAHNCSEESEFITDIIESKLDVKFNRTGITNIFFYNDIYISVAVNEVGLTPMDEGAGKYIDGLYNTILVEMQKHLNAEFIYVTIKTEDDFYKNESHECENYNPPPLTWAGRFYNWMAKLGDY